MEKGTVMKLAILISAHKDARHLRDLVDSLPQDAEFYIHIDRRRDQQHFKRLTDRPNVHFVSHRVSVIGGTLGEVEVQMALLRAALEGCHADRLLCLDSTDYPLWSNGRITDFFASAGDREFVSGIAMAGQGRAAYKYCDFQLFNDHHWRGGTWKNGARSLVRRVLSGSHVHKTLRIHCADKTYTLYKGSTSWAITPQMAQLILDEWDCNTHLRKYFSTSYRPVETFVPTVALNSRLAPQCRLVTGRYDGMEPLQPLTYSVGKTPKVLTEDDFHAALASGKMFCRQVVTGYSDGLKSLIDANRQGGMAIKDIVA